MKYILLTILLTGCSDTWRDFVYETHTKAKLAKSGYETCYPVFKPKNLKGYYCLEYKGDEEK